MAIRVEVEEAVPGLWCATISNAEQLTRRADSIGGDVQKLSSDPGFVDGLRSVTLGLGKFFDELYPSIKQPGKAN